MRVAIVFCARAQQQSSDDKANDPFFFRSQDELVPKFRPFPTFRNFHFDCFFTRGRTCTDE